MFQKLIAIFIFMVSGAQAQVAIDPSSIIAAEADSLLPAASETPKQVVDPWVANEWSMAQWRQTKFEEALSGVTAGTFVKGGETVEGDVLTVNIKTTDLRGMTSNRKLTLSRTAHSILLRKRMLQKLGLDFPAAFPLRNLTLNFTTADAKAFFKTSLEKTGYKVSRWITAETDLQLKLQDVVVSDVKLSVAHTPESVVPFLLSDLPENANLYAWTAGNAEDAGYRFPSMEGDAFHPNEDAVLKMVYRLARLNRADFEFIVHSAQFPVPVERLVVEKLISRSEALIGYYQIPHKPIDLDLEPWDPSADLDKGVLIAKVWTGYASQFSSLPLATPVSEIGGFRTFTRSQTFGLILATAVKQFNTLPFLHSNPTLELIKHDPAQLAKMIETYNQSGELQKTSLGVWGFGFASGELILSRDIVAGSYMGTHNLLQIVDQVGVRLDVYGQLQLKGTAISGPIGFDASAGGEIMVSRTYAHVKPIKSLTAANDPEFKSAALPFLIGKNAKELTVTKLNGLLKVGESLIITDSLTGNAEIRGAALIYRLVDLSASFKGSELILSRYHIFRKDAETYQVHQDVSESHQFALALKLGLRVKYPRFLRFLLSKKTRDVPRYFSLLSFQRAGNNGTATTQFYPVNLTSESVEWLKPALASANLELLESHIHPFKIRNHFREKTVDARAVLFSGKRLKSAMDITIEGQHGEKRNFVRDFFSKTSGKNLEKPGRDAIDYLANAFAGGGTTSFFTVEAVNPGYTMYGQAKNQFIQYEAEKMPDGHLEHSFVKVSKVYNGWKLSQKRLNKIMAALSQNAGIKLEAPPSFTRTKGVGLYNISLNTEMNETALKHLSSLSINQIYKVYKSEDLPREEDDRYDAKSATVASDIYQSIQSFRDTHSSKHLMNALSLAGDYFSQKQMVELLGGTDNIHVYTKFEGIGVNGEHQDKVVSLSSGKELVGKPLMEGPLSASQSQLGMTDGEFLSQWVTTPVY